MAENSKAAADRRRRRDGRAAITTAIEAGRAIKAGTRLQSFRLVDPAAPETGIVVHLDDAEAEALTASLAAILAKRLAV